MHILLISEDGSKSVGLEILREAATAKWPGMKIVAICPDRPMRGSSFSVTPNYVSRNTPHISHKQVGPDTYEVKGTPCDCLYLGLLHPMEFLGPANFGVVLTGVHQGSNVGADILHGGESACAALAASRFGLPALSFAQRVPQADEGKFELLNSRAFFKNAEKFAKKVLDMNSFAPGSCLNVNFPLGEPKGYRKSPPAMTSRWLPALQGGSQPNDIENLGDEFISVTDVELSTAATSPF